MDLRLYRHWLYGRLPNQNMIAKAEQSLRIIDRAVTQYKLDAFYCLVSGGNDSMALVHIASCHSKFAGVIHIDTLTGITDSASWRNGQPDSIATRYTRQITELNKWDLIIKSPVTSYDMLVIKHGFPGAAQHSNMYRYLKERPLRQAKQDAYKHAGSKKIAFVTGVRTSESVRRMGTVEDMHKDGMGVWIAPLIHWNKSDCTQLINAMQQPKNPVSIIMNMSGECGCGAFASPDEKLVIDYHYPEHGQRINHWQEGVKHFAKVNNIKETHCYWGHADGGRILPQGTVKEVQTRANGQQDFFSLCTDCVGSQFNRIMDMKLKAKQLKTEDIA